jgi:hypothetical protein
MPAHLQNSDFGSCVPVVLDGTACAQNSDFVSCIFLEHRTATWCLWCNMDVVWTHVSIGFQICIGIHTRTASVSL